SISKGLVCIVPISNCHLKVAMSLLGLQATGNVVETLKWHESIVRDCSWHPHLPTLVSSSWDGYLVRWEATEDDDDPTTLNKGKQKMCPEGYTFTL
uniref:Uncharacterized protein n=1 Tax=Aegilops tauschii subsp. strangulata TaxID=200361 RepID=A0A452XTY9_AEGTS